MPAPNANSELRARVVEEFQRWGDVALFRCEAADGKPFTVKLKCDEDELVPGLTFAFYGRFVTHFRYGRQFAAQSCCKILPHDERGVVAYLRQAPGVGPTVASKLWKLFASAAVETLRENPEEAAKHVNVASFTAARAKQAAAYLEQEKGIESATIDLMAVLSGKGMPRDTLKRCLRQWGNRAAEIVRKNPYVLMRFPGCGFTRADELYLERGGDPARLKRQALCAWNACNRDSSGSTWFDVPFVQRELQERIGSAPVRAIDAAKLAKRAGLLSVYRQEGKTWLTARARAEAEATVAERVAHFGGIGFDDPCSHFRATVWPQDFSEDLSDHQRQQLQRSLLFPLGILTGSPGTGKTYTAARLIARLVGIHGQADVAVVAPTGKAAVRISEALESYGLAIKAKTIHSFLGVVQADEGGFVFAHGPEAPVEERFVICDEASMVPIGLLARLLEALRDDGHLLLVGDVEQLAPVEHGAPLRDLIAAGVPTGRLTEIRRNAGAIVQTCARIRDEQPFELGTEINLEEGKNLVLRAAASGEAAAEVILRLVQKIRDLGLANPVWDCQVIVAVNEKSPLCRKELNRILQAELNSQNRAEGKWWLADKVVCLKNSFLPAVEEAMEDLDEDTGGFVRQGKNGGTEIYVANGELGKVCEVFPNRLILEFSSPRRIVLLPFGDGEPSLDLAYAISCHKSQGSEWPYVIVALDEYPGARMVCDRSWLYTGISRARKICFLVGKEETAHSMCRRQAIQHRKTFLVERLAAERERLRKEEEERNSHDASSSPEAAPDVVPEGSETDGLPAVRKGRA